MLRRGACSRSCSIGVLLCFASAVAAWELPRNAAALRTWRPARTTSTMRPREAAATAAVVVDLTATPLQNSMIFDKVAAILPRSGVQAYYTQCGQLVLLPVEPGTAPDAAAAAALRRHMEPKAWVTPLVEGYSYDSHAAGSMGADGKATSDHAMMSLAQALCLQLPGSRIAATVEAAPAKHTQHKSPQRVWKALLETRRVQRALAAEPAVFKATDDRHGNPLERVVLGEFTRLEPEESSRLAVELQRWCVDAQQRTPLSNDVMTVNVAKLPVASKLWDATLQHGLRAALSAACGLLPRAVRFAGAPHLHVLLRGAEPPPRGDERCDDAGAVTVPALTSYAAAAQGDQGGGGGGGDVAAGLMSFYVPLALSGVEAAATLSLEIQDSGLRFNLARGTGAVLCSKLRHTVTLHVSAPHGTGAGRDSAWPREPGDIAAAVLCGTAHLVHPALRGDIEHWRDGAPAWHVDRPWLRNSEVLDRCWRVDPVQGGARVLQQRSDAVPADSTASEGQRFALTPLDGAAHRYLRQRGSAAPEVTLQLQREGKTDEYTMRAHAECPGPRRRAWFGTNKQSICIGRAGFRSTTGSSAAMDAAIWELFGGQGGLSAPQRAVPVAPVVYVYVDPRYRGFGLGRRLFQACMSELAAMGVGYAVITVLDNGGGGLLPFYEGMGYRDASAHLGRGAGGHAIMLARLEQRGA
eukprot:TRINITY_DN3144_c0_g1_i1.p1 TRINITY_DN3144_c0_g1~~TRINITY_DN3144_c0_g1_i1.p1  ORF type:complete len:694 (-),score=224.16 TRINITY_DN3144_c0_g1_i1:387-2468(-)